MVPSSAIRRAASTVVPLAISGTQSYLRSSAPLAALNQSSRNLLRTPLVHRYFTKSKLDESLILVLESKVRCAVESQHAEEDEEVPQGFPFEIEDNPGQQTVTLTRRDYQGGTIVAEVGMPDLVTGEENDKNDEEEEGEGSGNQSSTPLAVGVSKENGPSLELEFACTASPDEITVNRLSIKDPENIEDQIAYKGPDFADLDENLQKAFHKYLEIRGIEPSTTNFLHGYMINKDARGYITWLNNVKGYVGATFNKAFFDPAGGGDPILYQHCFRFFDFKLPFSYSNLNTHRAICFNCLHNGTPTTSRSGFLPQICENWIYKRQSAGNQRHISTLVGTSEATRRRTYSKSFCEWLAGFIDGDGSIQVNKKGYASLEITTGLEDLRLLRYIQHMLGGSIKMRAGAKSYRYRLHNHLGMIKLLNCINGHIRHSARLLQLHRVCQVLEIPVIQPTPPDAQSNWFAGFFDADGTITMAMKHGLPELSIRVSNKLLQDVESYKVVFGGSLYFDSSQNGYYQWSIQSRKDVIMMLDYFKSSTFRSHKSRRFFLIEEYYSLYDLEAFKPDSIQHKAWLAFLDKWK